MTEKKIVPWCFQTGDSTDKQIKSASVDQNIAGSFSQHHVELFHNHSSFYWNYMIKSSKEKLKVMS